MAIGFATALFVLPSLSLAEPGRIHSIVELPFTDAERAAGLQNQPQVLADRRVYRAGERLAHGFALLKGPDVAAANLRLSIEAVRGTVVTEYTGPVKTPRVGFTVDLADLPAGKYRLTGHLADAGKAPGPRATFDFEISERKALTKPFPPGGLPLLLSEQGTVTADWPTHAAVPLAPGNLAQGERLGLEEDGRLVPAQVETVATWSHTGEPKWLHVRFVARYASGKPHRYVLRKLASGEQPPATALKCTVGKQTIVVDTGAVQFEVPVPFAGISRLWFDANRSGAYGAPLVDGTPSGPMLEDERRLTWAAAYDPGANVTIERNGPLAVELRSEGWYQSSEKRVAPFCRYVTRISAYAGQPIVRIRHSTILAADMRDHRLTNIQFRVPVAGGRSFALGLDGKRLTGQIASGSSGDPAASSTYVHQERPDRVRILNSQSDTKGAKAAAGRHCDGTFVVGTDRGELAMLVRDIWQKYPKEVEFAPSALSLHIWPRHGRRAYTLDEELDEHTFYKLPCFHQGQLMDLALPSAYFELFEQQKETTELRPQTAATASASGVAMTVEFALVPLAADDASGAARWRELLESNPIAMPDPAWCASTGALGDIAERGEDFAPIEDTIEDGLLGFANLDRIKAYGQFIYGNVHHRWLPEKNRAHLHRLWFNNHYHTASLPWMLFARSGSQPMLRWARTNTDYYSSVGQVRFDSLRGYDLGDGQRRAKVPEFKWHNPGAFYHCKSHVPWGGEAYGMKGEDSHAGLSGHWVDAGGLLHAWLIDADSWAKDGYELWMRGLREHSLLPHGGAKREANTTLAAAITAYDYSRDPTMLPAIYGMAEGLRSAPLATQTPGPLWQPLWITRYLEQTRDPAYRDFVIASAKARQSYEGIEGLALSALAYELSGDKQLLKRHSNWLYDMVRSLHKESDPLYNNFGLGPGPIGDDFLGLQWPYFKAALRRSGVDRLALVHEPGAYPHAVSTFDDPKDPRGCVVYVLKQKDEPWSIDLNVHSISSGDIHPLRLELVDPAGARQLLAARFADPQLKPVVRASGRPAMGKVWPVSADGRTGLYRIHITGYEAGIMQPLTRWPEAAVISNRRRTDYYATATYRSRSTRAYLVPIGKGRIKLTVASGSSEHPSHVRITDARGNVLINRSLLKSRPGDTATFFLNDAASPPAPWLIDIFSGGNGFYELTAEGAGNNLALVGSNLAHIELIRKHLSTAR